MQVLAVIGLSLAIGFFLFGFVEWLRFHDVRKDEHGKTYEEKVRAGNRRFRDRVNMTKAVWSKDIDKMDLAEKQEQEWAERRRFES